MDNEQFKELCKQVMDLRLDLARIETKMDIIKDISSSVAELDKRMSASESMSMLAHNRMDKIEKIHAWIFTGFGGAVIAAIATFIIRGGLAK